MCPIFESNTIDEDAKTKMLDELHNSTSDYVTYGDGDLGIPILRLDAIKDIESLYNYQIGEGTWFECNSNGSVIKTLNEL